MVNRVVYLAGLGSVAYRSFKQLRVAPADRDADSSRALLEQWTVLALLHSYQEFAEPLFSWLPLYSVVKLFLLAWVMVPQAEGSRVLFRQGVSPLMRRHEKLLEPFVRRGMLATARRLQAMAVHTGTLGAMATPELNRWIAHLQQRHAEVRARRLEFDERSTSRSPTPAGSDDGSTRSDSSWDVIETYAEMQARVARQRADSAEAGAAAEEEESKED